MTVQSVALRALWHRGVVAAIVLIAAIVTAASTRPPVAVR
jgi:hypothetical protein